MQIMYSQARILLAFVEFKSFGLGGGQVIFKNSQKKHTLKEKLSFSTRLRGDKLSSFPTTDFYPLPLSYHKIDDKTLHLKQQNDELVEKMF